MDNFESIPDQQNKRLKGTQNKRLKGLWKILKEMGIPEHITCLLRNFYTGKEVSFRTGHGKQSGSKLGKEYFKAV